MLALWEFFWPPNWPLPSPVQVVLGRGGVSQLSGIGNVQESNNGRGAVVDFNSGIGNVQESNNGRGAVVDFNSGTGIVQGN